MIKKALTFRAASIGDCLMGAYLLNNIHAQYPEAKLGIVVSMRARMIRELLAGYPYIEVVEANRRSLGSLWHLWRVWHGSDLVVTQYAGKTGSTFAAASKVAARLLAKKLIGFADAANFNSLLYTHLLPFNSDVAPAEHERQALRAAGLSVPLPYPILPEPQGTAALKKFEVEAGKYAIVHMFSGSTKRGLSPQKQRELVVALKDALPGVTLLVSGGAADRTLAEDAARNDADVIAGDADLLEMEELVAHAALVVSLDTGVAHIAAQLKRPLVVLVSCLGLSWWTAQQYGEDVPAVLMTNPVHSQAQHEFIDYPPCLDIAVADVVARAAAIVAV